MASANGRVVTGFSHPVVAKYDYSGSNVSYTEGMILARGVSVKLSINTSDSNDFYADNTLAETESGEFAGGTANLVVDGLHPKAEQLVLGLSEPEQITYGESKTVKVTKYGAAAKAPYVGIGYITEYTSGNTKIYVPTILRKGKFQQPGTTAKTREKGADWQTQELTADVFRDDTAGADWKWIGEDQATEAAAIEILHGILNITAVSVAVKSKEKKYG